MNPTPFKSATPDPSSPDAPQGSDAAGCAQQVDSAAEDAAQSVAGTDAVAVNDTADAAETRMLEADAAAAEAALASDPTGADTDPTRVLNADAAPAPTEADATHVMTQSASSAEPMPAVPTAIMGEAQPAPQVSEASAAAPTPADATVQGDVEQQVGSARRTARRKMLIMLLVIIVALAAAAAAFATYYVYTQVYAPAQQTESAQKASGKKSSSKKGSKSKEQTAAEKKAAEEAKAAEEQKAAEEKAAAEQKAAEEQAAAEQAAAEAQKQQEQQQKVADAQAQGKIVLTGTIRVFNTGNDLAAYYGGDDAIGLSANGGSDTTPYIVLELDSGQSVTAHNAADPGYSTRSSDSCTRASLDCGKRERVVGLWSGYNGVHATVACSDLWFQSDVSLPMSAVRVGDASVLY